MSHTQSRALCRLLILTLLFGVVFLSASLLGLHLATQAQTGCTGYNQCSSLVGESNTKLNGAITYSFDDASIAALEFNLEVQL